ncbi:MAG: hypothetical protein ACRDD1_19125, partial [Planctomycetia bacterium]
MPNNFYLYVFLGVVGVFTLVAWSMGRIRIVKAEVEAERKRLKETGKPTLCRVMMANETLRKPKPKDDDYSYAQVVFVRGFSGAAEKAKLIEIASALHSYKTPKQPTEDERILGQVLETHFPFWRPLLVPAPYACGAEAYSASLNVYWGELPGGTLQQEHLMIYALTGPNGGTLMMSLDEQS